jgi:hypothetical protein
VVSIQTSLTEGDDGGDEATVILGVETQAAFRLVYLRLSLGASGTPPPPLVGKGTSALSLILGVTGAGMDSHPLYLANPPIGVV